MWHEKRKVQLITQPASSLSRTCGMLVCVVFRFSMTDSDASNSTDDVVAVFWTNLRPDAGCGTTVNR